MNQSIPATTASAQGALSWIAARTSVEVSQAKCVPQLFEEQAARTPEAVAVEHEGQTLTYRELNQRANRLAHHLQTLGVGPEVLVGLWVERSVEMLVGMLGILKAGGAYVPLDPASPPDRLAFILKDTQTRLVLTQRALAGRLAAFEAEMICLDDEPPVWSAQPEGNLSLRIHPDSAIYIIYTSGSTGQPKGCCLTHRNVARLFRQTEAWFDFNHQDVWTLFHSPAFDFSVWEIWGALLYGGKLVIVPYLVSRAPQLFLKLLDQKQVTVLNQTPSAFKQLMAEALAAKPAVGLKLRYIIFGGEALDIKSLQPWFARHGDQQPRLINMYGVTETTVHVTYRPLTVADVGCGSVIGVPIPDLQVYVLDPAMNPCPASVPGEIYVGGPGVARGYLHRPELTADRFIPSPFVPGERLYRTGDVARRLPDNDLEYCGRLDSQVKVRGYRIELGEIESLLARFPSVAECAVQPQKTETGETSLSAFLVVREGAGLSVSALRSGLKGKLPDYMIPSRYAVLKSLPLTPNGKLDRQSLERMETISLAAGAEYIPPRTELERQLAAIWQEVLAVPQVGLDDNFFDLGGHSLLAMRATTRLGQALGSNFPVRLIFEAPTVAQWAEKLELLFWSAKAKGQEQREDSEVIEI